MQTITRRRGRKHSSIRLLLERLEDRTTPAVTIFVDAAGNLHPIDAHIYGENYGTTSTLDGMNLSFNRKGGNLDSRYNWQINAANHGSDYYFESIAEGSNAANGSMDAFIDATRTAGADPSITVPMIGWVANLGAGRSILPSFSVAKYGAQQDTDPFLPNAGNGVLPNGNGFIVGNNPNDANVVSTVAFERGLVQHLVSRYGTADAGGVRYYTLDNEPSIWHQTHRDVHPNGASMDEIRDLIVNYASMIKSVDPSAKILAPEEFGWTGYFLSGKDIQYGDTFGYGGALPDRDAHGGVDYLLYVLQQINMASAAAQQRLLDTFTVHFYPQAGEFSSDVSTQMQLLRNRSTRGLWDPNYINESYIADAGPDEGKVQLIRRLRTMVNTYYPGTTIGVTEYNWGAEQHMNGATAQADVLGIFGREGLDLANRFPLDDFGNPIGPTSPVYNAFRMFRNYDGQNSTFGDISTTATAPNADDTSAFSAIRSSDGALTIMVVNKKLYNPANPNATEQVTLNLGNFVSNGSSELWQLAATNPADQTVASIVHKANVGVAGNSLTVNVPMQSISLFVLRPSNAVATTTTTVSANANPSFEGSSVTFTATVTAGAGVPGGTVIFFDGTQQIGTGVLNGAGKATFASSTLTMGGHKISAVYQGNSSFRASLSPGLTQTVLSQAANITTVDGTAGNDTISVMPNGAVANSVIVFVNGNNMGTFTPNGPMKIRGLAGNDSISINPQVTVRFILEGGDGNDTITGGSGADTIQGQLGNDLMFGGSGDDLIFGADGADSMDGQDGADSMDGGDGPDFMFGSAGNDLMFGSAGSDALDGGIGDDAVDGGLDGDYIQASLGNDYLQGGGGNDSMDAGDGNDSMDGSDGDDVMFGLGGNDVIFGGAGNDSIDAGAGDDGVDAGAGNDLVFGSAGNDLMFGSSGDDSMDGNAGQDSMDGNDGNDLMFGSADNDLMFGSAGNDSMDGGLGIDAADGGTGVNLLFNIP